MVARYCQHKYKKETINIVEYDDDIRHKEAIKQ